MLEKNPRTVKLVFKNFPLPSHKLAFPAALAAMAAHEQGKFWAFHDRVFARSRELSSEVLREIAKEVGLDLQKFQQDMASQSLQQKIVKDVQDAQDAGVRGTPAIYVNGRLLQQRSPQAIQALIDKELRAGRSGR